MLLNENTIGIMKVIFQKKDAAFNAWYIEICKTLIVNFQQNSLYFRLERKKKKEKTVCLLHGNSNSFFPMYFLLICLDETYP